MSLEGEGAPARALQYGWRMLGVAGWSAIFDYGPCRGNERVK
jgi:hypothetical protein